RRALRRATLGANAVPGTRCIASPTYTGSSTHDRNRSRTTQNFVQEISIYLGSEIPFRGRPDAKQPHFHFVLLPRGDTRTTKGSELLPDIFQTEYPGESRAHRRQARASASRLRSRTPALILRQRAAVSNPPRPLRGRNHTLSLSRCRQDMRHRGS